MPSRKGKGRQSLGFGRKSQRAQFQTEWQTRLQEDYYTPRTQQQKQRQWTLKEQQERDRRFPTLNSRLNNSSGSSSSASRPAVQTSSLRRLIEQRQYWDRVEDRQWIFSTQQLAPKRATPKIATAATHQSPPGWIIFYSAKPEEQVDDLAQEFLWSTTTCTTSSTTTATNKIRTLQSLALHAFAKAMPNYLEAMGPELLHHYISLLPGSTISLLSVYLSKLGIMTNELCKAIGKHPAHLKRLCIVGSQECEETNPSYKALHANKALLETFGIKVIGGGTNTKSVIPNDDAIATIQDDMAAAAAVVDPSSTTEIIIPTTTTIPSSMTTDAILTAEMKKLVLLPPVDTVPDSWEDWADQDSDNDDDDNDNDKQGDCHGLDYHVKNEIYSTSSLSPNTTKTASSSSSSSSSPIASSPQQGPQQPQHEWLSSLQQLPMLRCPSTCTWALERLELGNLPLLEVDVLRQVLMVCPHLTHLGLSGSLTYSNYDMMMDHYYYNGKSKDDNNGNATNAMSSSSKDRRPDDVFWNLCAWVPRLQVLDVSGNPSWVSEPLLRSVYESYQALRQSSTSSSTSSASASSSATTNNKHHPRPSPPPYRHIVIKATGCLTRSSQIILEMEFGTIF